MATSKLLGGRYELGEVIGSGGMATVYRGTDRVLNRRVAIKVLSSEYARDENFVGRFRREARAAAKLNHPGVVSVYDSGSDDGSHFIVMELVEGATLADELARNGPIEPERAAQIAERVAAALQFAHDNGLVHRDVKPGNVMLTPSGEVKVMDFGIARATGADTFTRTSSVLGTVAYLAPEQAESKPVDSRTDVYALGVVLYEMLTGKPPFAGDSAVSVAYKHVREPPSPPTRSNSEVPAALEAVTLKALAKDPSARYQSAEEMREDLARAAGGAPVAATMLGATSPMGSTAPGAGPDSTMAMPPVDATSVLEPTGIHEAPPEPPRRRRRIWPFVLATALVIAGVALAVALVAGGTGNGPLPKGTVSPSAPPSRPVTPSAQPSPPASPSQSPPPATSPPPSPSPPSTPSIAVTTAPPTSPVSTPSSP